MNGIEHRIENCEENADENSDGVSSIHERAI
jgi:hypothetical protein